MNRADLHVVNDTGVGHSGGAGGKRPNAGFGCLLFIEEDSRNAGVELKELVVVVEPRRETPRADEPSIYHNGGEGKLDGLDRLDLGAEFLGLEDGELAGEFIYTVRAGAAACRRGKH